MMDVERRTMLGGYAAFNQVQTGALFPLQVQLARLPSQCFSKWLDSAFPQLNVVVLGPVTLVDRISSGVRPGIRRWKTCL